MSLTEKADDNEAEQDRELADGEMLQEKKCLWYPEAAYPACYHCSRPGMKQRCLFMGYRAVDPKATLSAPREPGANDASKVLGKMTTEEEERWAYLKEHPAFSRGGSKKDSHKKRAVVQSSPVPEKKKKPPKPKVPQKNYEEVNELVDIGKLALADLKWCYQDKVFQHQAASQKYRVQFEAKADGQKLILCYQDNMESFRTLRFDPAKHVSALRYHDDNPGCLLLWCITPLPRALTSKPLREKYDADQKGRVEEGKAEPEWALALFFPPQEHAAFRRTMQLLQEKYLGLVPDIATFTKNDVERIQKEHTPKSFQEATEPRLPCRKAFRILGLRQGDDEDWDLEEMDLSETRESNGAVDVPQECTQIAEPCPASPA